MRPEAGSSISAWETSLSPGKSALGCRGQFMQSDRLILLSHRNQTHDKFGCFAVDNLALGGGRLAHSVTGRLTAPMRRIRTPRPDLPGALSGHVSRRIILADPDFPVVPASDRASHLACVPPHDLREMA